MLKIYDRMGKTLSAKQAGKKAISRMQNIFLDFELMLIRWVGQIPLHSIRLLLYSLAGTKIGKGSTIHMWCNFFNPRGVEIGKDTIIGDHAFLDGRDNLVIGDHVDIASSVLIYNSQHDIDSEDFRPVTKKVIIEDYVFIGPRVIILPGVTIGKGAVVAAGAVVAKDVPPFSVVAGVPAKYIREREIKNPRYQLGRARLFQ